MSRGLCAGVVVAMLALAAVEALGQSVASAVRLNGQFDNRSWERAAVVRGFVQRDPREGAPATFPTEVRVVYDESTVYVSVRAFDPEPARLVGFLTRRDTRTSSDWIRVLIDSYHDRRTAYESGSRAARETARTGGSASAAISAACSRSVRPTPCS